MEWIHVNSTRVSAAAWKNNKTYLRFPDGAVYEYDNSSRTQHDELLNSPSIGKALITFEEAHKYRPV